LCFSNENKRVVYGGGNSSYNFTVKKVNPRYFPINHESLLYVDFQPQTKGICFCRFGDMVINGNINDKGQAVCRVPANRPGSLLFSLSFDLSSWKGEIPIYFKKEKKLSWNSVILILSLMSIIIGFTLAGYIQMKMHGKRKREKEDERVPFIKKSV